MRILLVTPPLTQVNTPYPATAYLTGFLKSKAIPSHQVDAGLELVLRLFSESGLTRIANGLNSADSKALRFFRANQDRYLTTIGPVIRFLQGKEAFLHHRIATRNFLPEGPRFQSLRELDESTGNGLGWAFGNLGVQDLAKHLASLYLDDLADVIRDGIDPRFEFSKYAEKLASSQASFEPLADALTGAPTLIDEMLDELTDEIWAANRPELICFSVPFPGNLYGALRMAKRFKSRHPGCRIVMGGGYPNTELREIKEPSFFDYVDFLTLDDGEAPLLAILQYLKEGGGPLLRTFVRENGAVVFKTSPRHDIPLAQAGTPSYAGLRLNDYLSLCELLNPMHRLWSDGRWNKLTVAHGCYWKKCTFCDTSLDYISRYEPVSAVRLVDRMEAMIVETGLTGFHFVDEAAPPKMLLQMAEEIIRRKLTVTWWGNIRFEKAFTQTVTDRLAESGCIAVTGGLEVASDRLLNLMEKGVTVEQVAEVTHHFAQSGILVHAYLMYGFPSQTVQETIDALERVRQLFLSGCIQSAFFHRFSVTAHSPVGKNPEKYGITLHPASGTFAKNDIAFTDRTGVDHSVFQAGLKKALYNYMHGACLEDDVRQFFDFPVPKPKVPPRFIEKVVHGA